MKLYTYIYIYICNAFTAMSSDHSTFREALWVEMLPRQSAGFDGLKLAIVIAIVRVIIVVILKYSRI